MPYFVLIETLLIYYFIGLRKFSLFLGRCSHLLGALVVLNPHDLLSSRSMWLAL